MLPHHFPPGMLGLGLTALMASFMSRMAGIVFAFVNAPLFATFLLGMFRRRTTVHGAFTGLVSGTLAAALHHGRTLPRGSVAGSFKGGWLGSVMHTYPSEMAQNSWTAIYAWTTCFIVTILVSLLTRPRPAEELRGLGRCMGLDVRPPIGLRLVSGIVWFVFGVLFLLMTRKRGQTVEK